MVSKGKHDMSGAEKFAIWWEGWGLGTLLATSLFPDLKPGDVPRYFF